MEDEVSSDSCENLNHVVIGMHDLRQLLMSLGRVVLAGLELRIRQGVDKLPLSFLHHSHLMGISLPRHPLLPGYRNILPWFPSFAWELLPVLHSSSHVLSSEWPVSPWENSCLVQQIHNREWDYCLISATLVRLRPWERVADTLGPRLSDPDPWLMSFFFFFFLPFLGPIPWHVEVPRLEV